MQPSTNPTSPYLASIVPSVFYVNYFDDISESKVRGLMALCSDILEKKNPATLYFAFSSKGGDVMAGVTLYNFLRGLPVQLVMHNIGLVGSIAVAVFLAADIRYACHYSRFILHGFNWGFAQSQPTTPHQLREVLSGLEQNENLMRDLVVHRSGLSAPEILAFFQQGATKDTAFAIEKGFVSDIRDFSLPSGAEIVTAIFP